MTLLGRARLWVREQLAFVAVVVVLLAPFAYLLAAPGRWGRATAGIVAALLLAALIRALVPSARVGLLAVRGRLFDTLAYLALGVLLLVVEIRLHG